MQVRRRIVLVALLAAALAFAATTAAWVRAEVPTVIETVEISVSGAQASPVVQAASLAAAASALAIAIGRRWGARIGAVVVSCCGLAVVVGSLTVPGRAHDVAAAAAVEVGGVREIAGEAAVTAAPYLTAVVGVALLAAGVLALVSAGSWQAAGQRYDRGAAAGPPRPRNEAERAIADWDALERGDDPSGRQHR